MEFIALIIALLVERFLHIDVYLNRFNWFSAYLTFIQGLFAKTGLFNGSMALVIIVVPILVVVAVVYYALSSFLWGFIGFLLAALILIYCLGPRDLYTNFESYFVAIVRENEQLQTESVNKLLCARPKDPNDEQRFLTMAVFSWFNTNIFTAIFWFLIFGPLAVVLYRCLSETYKHAHVKDSKFSFLLPACTQVLNIIEWIPVRIAALIFALVGDFHHCFTYWLKNVLSSYQSNYKFIQEAGLAALGIVHETEGSKNVAEIKSALRLIDRSLILFIVIVALFVLGAVLY